MTSKNLELWSRVEKTNPAHTKTLNYGRKITAVDAYHQIKNATEQFGPAGDGWGWEVKDTKFLPTNEVAVLISLWHGKSSGRVEQWGQASMYEKGKNANKPDSDCMKKATTDGLTKCLSFLGFNADIFLGMFDDNKYVQTVTTEFANKESQGTDKPEYADFENQKDWFEKKINEGEAPEVLIDMLEKKYKVSPATKTKIFSLGGK
jgi:hypothetical protein